MKQGGINCGQPYFYFLKYLDSYQLQNLLEEFEMQEKQTDYFKYKGAIFYVFAVSLLGAIIGVEFFVDFYYMFALLSLAYCLLKYIQMVLVMLFVNCKYSTAMKNYKKRLAEKYYSAKEITHVFILPNYNEQIQLLRETIRSLAKHTRSNNYCVFLAMEHHQFNAEEKAKLMLKQFSSQFRLISYTVHEVQPGQSKTKSSNINFCARNMTHKLLQNYVNMDNVIVTVMDSDSIIPEAYVDQVQQHMENNYEKRHTFIYQPPQFFTRNEREVAFFVRIMDNLMSFMHCSNLFSIFGFTLGVSNYSLSYRLLERIDFWDTCIYSKGQDIRTPAKAIWKTNGQVKTCPIYIPINQLSLATGQGRWADCKARFIQAKRHSQDQTQVSYNLVNMCKSKMNIVKRLYMLFSICEVYMMLIVIPVPGIVLILQDILQILPRSRLDQGDSFFIFNNINTVILIIGFALFEVLKNRASNTLYGIKPMNMFYAIQTPLLQIPVALLFGFIPMVLASYSMLTDKITFTVTPKTSLKNNGQQKISSESMFQSEQIEEKQLIDHTKIENSQIVKQNTVSNN